MKEELLQIFPTPVLITKYEGDLSKEIKYVDSLPYKEQKANANFKSQDTYLLEIEQLKKDAPAKIHKIAIETSSELIQKLIGTEINNSSISAIVDDFSKTNGNKYYGN